MAGLQLFQMEIWLASIHLSMVIPTMDMTNNASARMIPTKMLQSLLSTALMKMVIANAKELYIMEGKCAHLMMFLLISMKCRSMDLFNGSR
jgi:hypothetical protein